MRSYHIEEYHFGFVVCFGATYGDAVSRAFETREEAQRYLEQLLEVTHA